MISNRLCRRALGAAAAALMTTSLVSTGSVGASVAGTGATPSGGPSVLRSTVSGRPRGHQRPNIVLLSSDDQTDGELRYLPRTRRLLTARA